MVNKFFNGSKYWFSLSERRWRRTTDDKVLSRHIWNFFHPNDLILKGDGYVIHHENGDSSDDRIENLRKMTRSEHQTLHMTGKHHADEVKKKMSEAKIGKYCGKNNPMFGKHHTEEAKQKMSEARLGHTVTDETKQKIRNGMLGSKNPNWKGGKKNEKTAS